MANVGNPNWLKGAGGNPKGRPANVFASQGDVAAALMDRYPPSEILAIAADTARLDKLGSWSAIVLLQLANMLKAGDDLDCAVERERLLDRTVGKAVQHVEAKVSVSAETESALLEGRRRVALSRGESLPEVSYSVVEPAPVLSDEEVREARRERINLQAREYRAKMKTKGKPSFNELLAKKSECESKDI